MSSPLMTTHIIAPKERDVPSRYRKSAYRDGPVVRIHEARRHRSSPDDSAYPPAMGAHSCQQPLGPKSCSNDIGRSMSIAKSLAGDGTRKEERESKDHVTCAIKPKSKKAKAKVIVVQSRETIPTVNNVPSLFFETYTVPTPPPTPKIERLPTPDLERIREAMFCTCCNETRRKHCVSCTCDTPRLFHGTSP
ncbi:hypothetical protein BU24DRAFT_145658 [Aaosphaeria arxii CBS 175.79]|uniref:Uncharacterized protein n=1 Tax=Aaosphaeria arxii CBS 175.79 TaxID=1450172 RepID=A0A6A5XWG6_9PLEO|nr:uncharacterized protein BU24DRAFT_145658 [Aaosphaeria arxii CBS 175.79]KAF2017187.1 hypothetical protein BU24DRAFT_145658 [Aaosphaeria arxii CBS 175.79]